MSLESWRDLAVVLLAAEGFLAVLVVGAAIYFAIRGVFWLRARVPVVTRPARAWLARAELLVRRAGSAGMSPFVWLGANGARLHALWQAAVKRNGRDGNE